MDADEHACTLVRSLCHLARAPAEVKRTLKEVRAFLSAIPLSEAR